VTSGIVDDDDGDELSALSMHGHEIRLCPITVCIELTRGYCMYQGSVSYQACRRRRRRCR
jgi:hypothetical protein